MKKFSISLENHRLASPLLSTGHLRLQILDDYLKLNIQQVECSLKDAMVLRSNNDVIAAIGYPNFLQQIHLKWPKKFSLIRDPSLRPLGVVGRSI